MYSRQSKQTLISSILREFFLDKREDLYPLPALPYAILLFKTMEAKTNFYVNHHPTQVWNRFDIYSIDKYELWAESPTMNKK